MGRYDKKWKKITRQGLFPAWRLCGEDDHSPPEEDQVEACRRWLRAHARPAKGLCRGGFVGLQLSSYSFKHAVEGWLRRRGAHQYVANGAFIEAAVREGYRLCRTAPGSPNANFYMALRKTERAGLADQAAAQ